MTEKDKEKIKTLQNLLDNLDIDLFPYQKELIKKCVLSDEFYYIIGRYNPGILNMRGAKNES